MAPPASASHDTPAIVLSSLLGVAAILGTVFFLPQFYCENPSATCTTSGPGGAPVDFDVAWAREAGTTQTQTFTASGSFKVDATAIQAGAKVAIGACTDSATAPLQQKASITYTISNGINTTKPIAFTCPTTGSDVDLVLPAPDFARAFGTDAASAKASILSNPKVASAPATYTVQVTIARPSGTVPSIGGPGAPTVSVTMQLTAMKYNPTLTPHKNEVAK
jgi:hypothetical protein